MNKWKRGLKRITAIVVAVILAGTTVDMSAFTVYAEESMQSGLCEHHTEHTDECGYAEAQEGSSCTHECSEESGCIILKENCSHSHDDTCGYKEAVEGAPCTFVCDACEAEEEVTPACTGQETADEPICTCGTDDESIHATNCPAYEAPENPECYCAEECVELNVWCDICGFDYAACKGTDSAVDYEAIPSGTCGDNLSWTLDKNGTLTISGSGAMTDYTSLSNVPWYNDRIGIKIVVIGDEVTSIGDKAFECCIDLKSVTIGNSVTSIGDYAFNWCGSLTKITIPASVEKIGDYVFVNCSSLTAINVDSENAFYVSNDGILFTKEGTTLVAFPGGKAGVYTIPASVRSIGDYAFSYCSRLTSITIPASVTSIGHWAFSDCKSLTKITIPASVTSIGNATFSDCWSLTSITIPASVTSIGDYAFSDCWSLTQITIPASVRSIGTRAFGGCSKLYRVHYLGTEEQWNTVTKGKDALPDTLIHIPTWTPDAGGSTHSWRCPEADCGVVFKTEDHTWDAGVVTKEATTTEKGVKTYTCSVCKTTKVEYTTKPTGYDTAEKTEKTITTANTDKGDVKGSTFAAIQLKAVGKNKSVKLTWKKVKDADGYILYAAQCGKKLKKLKTFTGASKVEYTHKKLKNAKYYKYMVVAYKTINGKQYTIAASKSAHAVTNGGKYANPTKVTVKVSKLSIKKGAKKTIQASYKLPKNKKLKVHIAKFRYESDNPKVATVTSKGVVKGKKKGTANIYVYTQNGVYKKVKVTVK